MFVKILELCWGLNGIIHKEYLHWAYVIVCHCEYYYQLLGNGLTIKNQKIILSKNTGICCIEESGLEPITQFYTLFLL